MNNPKGRFSTDYVLDPPLIHLGTATTQPLVSFQTIDAQNLLLQWNIVHPHPKLALTILQKYLKCFTIDLCSIVT